MTWPGTLFPSPGGQHVAVVGTPQEVWGNHLAGFALWEVASPPRLLYHRAGHSAHALRVHQAGQLTFLHWSQAGDWLTLYEFKRQQTYQVVFIRAGANQVFRLPATAELLARLPAISHSSPQIEAFLQQAAPSVGALVRDNAPAGLHLR